MKKYLSLIGLALCLACTEPAIDTFGNIGGVVSDASTGAPLGGTSVRLTPTGYSQVTGTDGTFQFDNLDVQEYTLTFTRLGYETYQHKVTVKPGLSSSVQVMLRVAEASIPTLFSGNPTNLTSTSVRLHATISSMGNSQISQYGFCYATHNTPDISDEHVTLGSRNTTGEFAADLSDLSPETTYYCRAYAQNTAGIAYSDEIYFKTLSSGSGSQGGEIAVKSGLMAYYRFDDGDASDSSEYEVDGQAVNEPNFITDTPNGSGKALFLNGNKEQYININYNLFKGLNSFSISLWIKDFTTGVIVSGVSTGHEAYCYPRAYVLNNGQLAFCANSCVLSSSPSFAYALTSIQSGTWHNLAITCEALQYNSATFRLYIDGVLTDSISGYAQDNSQSSVTKINIGGNSAGFYNVYPSMKVDNVRFYNRCLSNNDVKNIYDAEK